MTKPQAPSLRELDERRRARNEIGIAASEPWPPYALDRSALGCADALMAVFGMTSEE